MKKVFAVLVLSSASVLGCTTKHTVRLEPMQIKPIHVTMDVNVHVESESAEGDDEEPAAPREPAED